MLPGCASGSQEAVPAGSIWPTTLTIYHADPKLALVAGARSRIDRDVAAGILKEAGVTGSDFLKDAMRIGRWIEFNFAGAEENMSREEFNMVGKETAQTLIQSRKLRSCLDWAILKSALLRSAGYPTLIAEGVDVQWMLDVRDGHGGVGIFGHVLVEVYTGGRWVLLDSTSSQYIPDYDPVNPLITKREGDGNLCVMGKGRDPHDYDLGTTWDQISYMRRFAKSVDPAQFYAPRYKYLDLPGAEAPLPDLSDAALARSQPNHPGVVVQIRAAGLDIHVEKAEGRYLVHLYRYGRVFQGEPINTLSFSSRTELKRYLWSLQP